VDGGAADLANEKGEEELKEKGLEASPGFDAKENPPVAGGGAVAVEEDNWNPPVAPVAPVEDELKHEKPDLGDSLLVSLAPEKLNPPDFPKEKADVAAGEVSFGLASGSSAAAGLEAGEADAWLVGAGCAAGFPGVAPYFSVICFKCFS